MKNSKLNRSIVAVIAIAALAVPEVAAILEKAAKDVQAYAIERIQSGEAFRQLKEANRSPPTSACKGSSVRRQRSGSMK